MYGRSNADQVSFAGGGGDLSGSFDMWGTAVNFFYDIPTAGPFRPYAVAEFPTPSRTHGACFWDIVSWEREDRIMKRGDSPAW